MTGPQRKGDRLTSVVIAGGCGTATVLLLTGNSWGSVASFALTFWVSYGILDWVIRR
jgi:hypothetical protein